MMTRREKMVKKALLKELRRMSGGDTLGGLSYAEKQYLEKTLDVDFIDRELEKMAQQKRLIDGTMKVFIALSVLAVLFVVGSLLAGMAFEAHWHVLLPLVIIACTAVGMPVQQHFLRRRRFLYEALRELSNADEKDIPLSRALEQADALIEQIVDREIDIEERHIVRTKSYV